MLRWAWRLFRREWRQQLLILLLIVVAVAAVVVGAAVAVNTPPPAERRLRHGALTWRPSTCHADAKAPGDHALPMCSADRPAGAALRPGAGHREPDLRRSRLTQTYQLRSQDPHGPYGGPMLQLLSGSYPTGPDQVAVTPGLASDAQSRGGRHLAAGRQDRRRHRAEPAEPAGRVRAGPARAGDEPDRRSRSSSMPRRLASELPSYITPAGSGNEQRHQPVTIVLALATVGMLLIALVSIGGFTVLAQRRMRSLGCSSRWGRRTVTSGSSWSPTASSSGFVGAVLGFALGLVLWLLYRPHNEQSAHHVIGTFALPWNVIVPAMVLAVVATFFAAGYPARAITRVPVVSALGRTSRAAAPDPPLARPRRDRPGHRVRHVLALGRGGERRRRHLARARAHRVDRGDHPGLALLPGPAGPGRQPVAHRRSPALPRHGALPGPLRLGPLGHQPRHHDRGHHLRRRRGPLLQCLRLRRTEHDGEHDQRVQPAAGREPTLLAGQNGPQTQTAPAPPSMAAQLASVHAIASAVGANHVVELVNPSVGLQNPSGRAGSGTDPSTWPRPPSCGPTASTPRRSPPTSTSSARGPGWPARACS